MLLRLIRMLPVSSRRLISSSDLFRNRQSLRFGGGFFAPIFRYKEGFSIAIGEI